MVRYSSLAIAYGLVIVPGWGLALDVVALAAPDIAKPTGVFLKDALLGGLVLWGIIRWRTKRPFTFAALAIVVGYCLLSWIWVEKHQSWEVVAASIRNYGLYPFVFFLAHDLGRLRIASNPRVFKFFCWGIILNVIVGVLQATSVVGSPYLQWVGKDVDSFVWVHGGFASYIEYAFYLSFCTVLLALSRDEKVQGRLRAIVPVIVLASGALVILSQSRTGFVTWAIAASLFLAIVTSLRTASIVVAIAVPAALAFFIAFMPSYRLVSGDATEDLRVAVILPFAIKGFLNAPFFGNGVGSYGAASIVGDYAGDGLEYLDSTLLSIGLQFGMVGTLLYFGFIATQFMWIDSRARKDMKRALRMSNVVVAILVLIYSTIFNFADGWPGAIYVFGWLGYMRGLLSGSRGGAYLRERALVASPVRDGQAAMPGFTAVRP